MYWNQKSTLGTKLYYAGAKFFSVYHRKHPKFQSDPEFQVAFAVSFLRVLNVWQGRKLTNIPPDSDSDLDSTSETLSWKWNCLFSTDVIFQVQTRLIDRMRGRSWRMRFVSKVHLGLGKVGKVRYFSKVQSQKKYQNWAFPQQIYVKAIKIWKLLINTLKGDF